MFQVDIQSSFYIEANDPLAMHIDATILSLREDFLVYNPDYVTKTALRSVSASQNWDLRAFPFTPEPRSKPPLFMLSSWIVMNVLVLDGRKVLVEEQDVEFSRWLEELEIVPILDVGVSNSSLCDSEL